MSSYWNNPELVSMYRQSQRDKREAKLLQQEAARLKKLAVEESAKGECLNLLNALSENAYQLSLYDSFGSSGELEIIRNGLEVLKGYIAQMRIIELLESLNPLNNCSALVASVDLANRSLPYFEKQKFDLEKLLTEVYKIQELNISEQDSSIILNIQYEGVEGYDIWMIDKFSEA